MFVGMGFNDDPYYMGIYAHQMYNGQQYLFTPAPAVTWGTRIGVYYPVVMFWKIFGINELSTSIYFILLSLGSIFVTYLIGKELFNVKIGLTAAFILSIFPMNIIYSSQIGPDIGFQFLSALSILLLIKSEKNQKFIFPILCGLVLGTAYLFKSTVILILPIFVLYVLINLYKSKVKLRKYFTNKRLISYVLIAVAFFTVFGLQLIHFHEETGEWFYAENTRSLSLSTDPNSNSDLEWYPKIMFNYEDNYFEWIHTIPLMGFLYYFVIISSAYLIFKRNLYSIFFFLWFIFLFLFFEFGLQLYCTKVVDYCLYARHPRFLTIFTIPAILLIAIFFNYDKKKWRKYMSIICIVFLAATSLFYAYQSYVFIRSGTGGIRESTNYIKELPKKNIYVPNPYDEWRIDFYLGYDEDYGDLIKFYRCDFIDCDDPYYNYGDFIKDSYVVTYMDPYSWLNEVAYPEFMKNPPKHWKLLKIIDLERFGFLENYQTKIYYVE